MVKGVGVTDVAIVVYDGLHNWDDLRRLHRPKKALVKFASQSLFTPLGEYGVATLFATFLNDTRALMTGFGARKQHVTWG